MSVIVGSLQVDVTTGQATFTFDDAKKKLDDFGNSAQGASEKLDYSMREARESITLTGDALGVHLPGGIARAIASIGPLGPALEAAMPIAAIVAGIVLITEGLEKWRAAQEKIKLETENAGSAVAENMRGLEDKFLQAGIRADELSGNHLGALRKQLELIDNQTLGDLEHEFEALGKIADTVFDGLKSHWYTIGEGSKHATYNLAEYEAAYRNTLALKGESAANADLQKQIEYEKQILSLQQELRGAYDPKSFALGDYLTKDATKVNELKAAGIGITDNEIKAQQELVDILNKQVSATALINATANLEKGTDTKKENEDVLKKKLAAWDEQFKAALRYRGELEKLNREEQKREDASEDSNEKKGMEEDKQWAEYMDKLAKAMEKTTTAQVELNAATKEASVETQIEAYKRLASEGLISEQQLAQKLKPLYQQESQDKMDAIQAQINQQNDIILAAQKSGETIKAEEAKAAELKLQADLLKIKQQGAQQQNQLDQQINAQWQQMATQMQSGFNNSIGKTIVEGKNFGQEMRGVAIQILEQMISTNLKWLENTILTNQARATSTVASGEEATTASLAQSLRLRFDAAKTAAAKAMTTVPFPLDLVVAPLVFAAALAFAGGGIVPGSGSGDTVPAMLTPGEAVLPKPMVEKLSQASSDSGDHHHWHYSPTVHADMIDASDLKDKMMELKDEFIKTTRKEMRRRHK